MGNVRDRIILFPRYTTLAGAGDFRTLPINISGYESGDVMIWIGTIVGPTSGGGVTGTFEESTDQVHWTECDGTSPALVSGQEVQFLPNFTKPWMRLTMSVALGVGNDPVVSSYAVGYLQRRKGARPPG